MAVCWCAGVAGVAGVWGGMTWGFGVWDIPRYGGKMGSGWKREVREGKEGNGE